jgi:D-alanyl-D-alanine carboxypeptidase
MLDMSKLGATVRRRKIAVALFGFTIALALEGLPAAPAQARHHHQRHHAPRPHFAHRAHHGHHAHFFRPTRGQPGTSHANIAAIVVDGNSGRTLYARSENELRHPASITKVMTLYLLFEQLEQGRLRLDSDIRVSHRAAAQAPTKLGLRPGQAISVDDAVKAIVTRSANDIAVAIAETVGGDEESFADLMTRKAHALGMSRTHFENASGLPNNAQVTSAHDLAILGRAVQERFPRYYRYFATHAFYYGGATIMNHNHLLGRVEGMDGIKTGYTRASGFNLLTSVKRDGHYIVAVVLGGASAPSRDRIMADLIEDQIENGATVRTAAAISETAAGSAVAEAAKLPQPSADRPFGSLRQDAEAKPEQNAGQKLALPAAPPKPAPAVDPIQVASINPEVAFEKPRPAFVSGGKPFSADPHSATREANSKTPALDGSTARPGRVSGASATATPSTTRSGAAPATLKDRGQEKTSAARPESDRSDSIKVAEAHRPAAARSGWMIQIGATDDVTKANALLARAKTEGAKALTAAQPFTEKVQKGSETLYRARFAGLQAESAELACKALKRSGFSCFPTKN